MWRGGLTIYARAVVVAVASLAVFAVKAESAPPASASGDANQPKCAAQSEASPGFASYLPDCRAYELVTPTYEGDEPALGLEGGQPLISPDGEHLLSFDFAGFAGAENLEESLTDYLGVDVFSRTEAGWTAESVEPPASLYPRSKLALGAHAASASAELNRTLWELDVRGTGSPEEEFARNGSTLGVREAVGGGAGRFTLLGPGVSDPTYLPDAEGFKIVGASSELTHVLLDVIAGPHASWPGDETAEEAPSLYEYQDREGYEPVLVGVSNAGALHGADHVNEGADLVSDCGTTFNAVSEDGRSVDFTADHVEGCTGRQPVASELDARVDGEKTIDLSEPPLSGAGSIPERECSGECQAAEETAPQPATFRGAAADGTEVFFTTEQPLVNAAAGGGPYLYEETITKEGLGSHATALVLIAKAKDVTGVAAVAKEGTRIYFESPSVLTAEPNANGETAELGVPNLYVADVQTPGAPPAFVAREPSGAQEAGEATGLAFETTASGRFLLFGSARHLEGTNDVAGSGRQLFEYDTETRSVSRVSAGARAPGGAECAATQTLEEFYGCDGSISSNAEAPKMALPPDSSISEEGTVVFASRLPLTAQAVEGRDAAETLGGQQVYTENVYEYVGGNVYLLSAADEATPLSLQFSRLYGVDGSGADVFFGTTNSLVPQDVDSEYSWYDARVDGGFPAPVLAAGCAPGACQGGLAAPPALPSPESNAPPVAESPPVSAPVVVKRPTPAEVRAKDLARALKACRKKANRGKRRACEVSARKKYGPAKKSSGRAGK